MAFECLNSLKWKENGFSRALNGFQTNFCDFGFPNKYMNSKFQRYCLVCKIAEAHRWRSCACVIIRDICEIIAASFRKQHENAFTINSTMHTCFTRHGYTLAYVAFICPDVTVHTLETCVVGNRKMFDICSGIFHRDM